jgi:hypothetical protein
MVREKKKKTNQKKKKKNRFEPLRLIVVVARPTNNGSYYRACDNIEGTLNCQVVLGRFVDCFGSPLAPRKLQIAFLKIARKFRLSGRRSAGHALRPQQLSSPSAGRCRCQ